MTVVKPNIKTASQEAKQAVDAKPVVESKDPYEGMDSATKARMQAADKARVQSMKTQSKLNVQDSEPPIKT